MERLKVLRARCGLDNQGGGGADYAASIGRPMSTGSMGQCLVQKRFTLFYHLPCVAIRTYVVSGQNINAL